MDFKKLVRHKKTVVIGVTTPDLPGILGGCEEGEVPVYYEDLGYCRNEKEEVLEIIGDDPAVIDMKACGAGKGKDCCKFLGLNCAGKDSKMECLRFGSLYWQLVMNNKMVAQREPKELYPKCLLDIKKSRYKNKEK